MGIGAGGPMTILAAASHPDRVDGLVLVNTAARHLRAPDYPHGMPEAVAQAILADVQMRGPDRRRLLAGRATRHCWATGGRTTLSCGNGWQGIDACRSVPARGWRRIG